MEPVITQILAICSPIFTTIVLFFVRQNNLKNRDMEKAIDALGNALSAHKLDNANNYARKDDMVREYNAIMSLLQRIEDKLDKKVDR